MMLDELVLTLEYQPGFHSMYSAMRRFSIRVPSRPCFHTTESSHNANGNNGRLG
jgi:hypothetical protein